MLWIVGICAGVACLAVVAIAVATVRAMHRLEKATAEVSILVGEAGELTRDARATLSSIRGAIDPIGRVLGEAEAPLNTAVAVARTVKSITGYLMQRFSHKLTRGSSAKNGEHDGS
jgi:hypothetical protein